MKRFFKHFSFVCFCVFFCLAGLINADQAVDDTVITWGEPHFPPYVITKGANENKGIDDLIKQDIGEHLTGYTHVFRNANYAKILDNIKKQKHMLITPLFKTAARQKYVHYSSIPSYLVLPNGFIINKADKKRFKPYLTRENTLDIEKLITSEDISIGINLGRSYSGILDEMIRKHGASFYKKSSIDLSESMIKMLKADRFDAMLGFPVEVKFVAQKAGIDYNDFEVLPVNGMVLYSAVYFGGPKNEWGRNVIDKLDEILLKDGTIPRYVKFYENWLNDRDKQRYKKILERVYSKKYPQIYSAF
ncbi:MAG: TIGR02285 family protein [Desulfobacterales bacterium]|nr:TIGR02285 family protein [Desulfobacterales bacterium]